MLSGIIQPLFGRVLGDTVYIIAQDYTVWGVEYKQVEVPAYFREYAIYICAIAVGLGIVLSLRFYAFGVLSMRLTLKLRKIVYTSIL